MGQTTSHWANLVAIRRCLRGASGSPNEAEWWGADQMMKIGTLEPSGHVAYAGGGVEAKGKRRTPNTKRLGLAGD